MAAAKKKTTKRARKRKGIAATPALLESAAFESLLEERAAALREVRDRMEARRRGLLLAMGDHTDDPEAALQSKVLLALEAAEEGLSIAGIEDYAMLRRGTIETWEQRAWDAERTGAYHPEIRRLGLAAAEIRALRREFEIRLRRRMLGRNSSKDDKEVLARLDPEPGPKSQTNVQINNHGGATPQQSADATPKRRGVSRGALDFVREQFLFGPVAPDRSEYVDGEGVTVDGGEATEAAGGGEG